MSKGRVEEAGLVLVTLGMRGGEKGDRQADRHRFLSTSASPKQEVAQKGL